MTWSAQKAGNGDHTNVFLSTGTATDATIELTHNWDGEDATKMDPQGDRKYEPYCRTGGGESGCPALSCTSRCAYTCRNRFGHIAIGVDDIYGVCQTLSDMGYAILRPPRDGHMAFVKVSVFCGCTFRPGPCAVVPQLMAGEVRRRRTAQASSCCNRVAPYPSRSLGSQCRPLRMLTDPSRGDRGDCLEWWGAT